MAQPLEVTQAVMADGLAQRYGARPSRVLKWDAADHQIASIAIAMQSKPKPTPKPHPVTPREAEIAEAIDG